MIIDTVSINNSKIKFRHTEKYTSSAANIQSSVNDPGVYQGCEVVATSTPSQSIMIMMKDGASLALHHDYTNGYSTVVRETSDITLDLSSFDWPIVTGATWYVFLSVTYDENSETSGYWGVSDLDGLPANAVKLATIYMPDGATTVIDAYIKYDGVNQDKPTKKRPILVRKKASIAASTGRTRFQIPDDVCFLGEDAKPSNRVFLTHANDMYKPLSDPTYGFKINPLAWYPASTGSSPLTISDMNYDGVCYGPWVAISPPYDGAFDVYYYSPLVLEDLDTSGDQVGFTSLHATDIQCESVSDSPDSLSMGTLTSLITSLLSLVNNRVKSIHPTATDTSWILLWRSNNKTTDASVDNKTLSLYFKDKGMVLIGGGYLVGDNVTVPSGVSSSDVFAHSCDGALTIPSFIKRWKLTSGPASMDLYSRTDWDYYHETGKYVSRISQYMDYISDVYSSVAMSGIPGSGGLGKYVEILRLCENELRVYYSSASDDSSLIIATGVYWLNSTSKWLRASTASKNAMLFVISRKGIRVKTKLLTDANFATGWSDSEWSHETLFNAGSNPDIPVLTKGKSKETLLLPFQVTLNSGHIKAMWTASYNGPTLYASCNYRIQRFDGAAITDGDLNFLAESSYNLTDISSTGDQYSRRVSGKFDILPLMKQYTVVSTTAPDTIEIEGETSFWIPGQLIALRDTSLAENKILMIVDFTVSGGNTILTIDEFGGHSYVGTSSASGRKIYTVHPEDENKVIEIPYLMEVY